MTAEDRAGGIRAPHRLTRRGIVVLGIVLVALLAFGSTTQTWLNVRLPQDAVQTPDLAIAGSDAAVPVTAFALVALAAALAVSIAGRVARWIIAVILVLAGVGIIVSSAGVALDPRGAAEPAIGTAIGVSGSSGASASATALPWVAVVAGVLLAAAAAWVVLAGRTWGVNRRYDAGAARVPRPAAGGMVRDTRDPDDAAVPASIGDIPPGVRDDGVASGGEQDVGNDAADGRSRRTGGTSPERTRRSTHSDEIDSWDQLSRGNDPTG